MSSSMIQTGLERSYGFVDSLGVWACGYDVRECGIV